MTLPITAYERPDASQAIPHAPLAPPQQLAEETETPSLQAVAAAIRRDACQDPVTYLLRSDTQQHGE